MNPPQFRHDPMPQSRHGPARPGHLHQHNVSAVVDPPRPVAGRTRRPPASTPAPCPVSRFPAGVLHASPNPTLYTLEVPPGPVRRGGPKVIELRSIGLARYLERSQIVRSSGKISAWTCCPMTGGGEPLDTMIGRVLVRALTQRLPGSTVYSENGAISAEPDATLQVNLQRMDLDTSGAVRLIAQYAVVRRTSDTRGVTLEVPVRTVTPPRRTWSRR